MNKDMENTFNQMAELGGSEERLGRNTGPVINAPLLPKDTRPAPAATDTGLETVEYQVRSKLNGHWVKDNFLSQQLSPDTERRELITRSQAEELLAAERADKRIWMEKAAIEAERVERLEADNAAQAARIKELECLYAGSKENHEKAYNTARENMKSIEALEAKLAAAEKALEFYADVSKYPAPFTGGFGELYYDCGEKARAVLSEK